MRWHGIGVDTNDKRYERRAPPLPEATSYIPRIDSLQRGGWLSRIGTFSLVFGVGS